MKNIFIYVLLLSVGAASSFGNDTILKKRPQTWVMGVPQHLINNGMRIEIDKQLRNPANWITFSPVFYFRGQETNLVGDIIVDWNFASMLGGGLSVFLRHYPNHDSRFRGFYMKAGAGYEMIAFNQSGFKWESINRDGIDYYVPGPTEIYRNTVNSFSVRFCIGYKFHLDPHLAVDVFIGPGLRYSTQVTPGDATIVFDRLTSRGFEGTHLAAGIRFGVGW